MYRAEFIYKARDTISREQLKYYISQGVVGKLDELTVGLVLNRRYRVYSPIPEPYGLSGISGETLRYIVSDRVRTNLSLRNARSNKLDREMLPTVKVLKLQWGKLISEGIKGPVDEDEWISNVIKVRDDLRAILPARVSTRLEKNLREITGTELFVLCASCGVLELADELSYVITNTNDDSGDMWCDSCVDQSAEWSELMEEFISHGATRGYYDNWRAYSRGDVSYYVTRAFASRQGYYTIGGAYVSEEVYDEYRLSIDGDDDEYEDSDGLMGYHDSDRNFVEVNSDKSRPALGVELEVYVDGSRRKAVEAVRNAMPRDTYLERDGSLDDDQGFEIITQPYGMKEWRELAPKMLSTCKEYDIVGYDTPGDESYGIHISVARAGLTRLQEVRMAMFLESEVNAHFVRAIAQRWNTYNSSDQVGIGSKPEGTKVRSLGTKSYAGDGKLRWTSESRYVPLNLKYSIAEFRIFQSTTFLPSYMKNLEFVWALIEWTNPATASGTTWSHVDFTKWLGSRPDAEKDFPNLMSYLRKPEYRVKNYEYVIKNSWAGNLKPPVRSSLPVNEDAELEAA